jgi:hypothetical protein
MGITRNAGDVVVGIGLGHSADPKVSSINGLLLNEN